MSTRQRGEGSIDQLPSGRWRVRIPDGTGRRITLGIYSSPGEAERRRLAALVQLASGEMKPIAATTLRSFGERFLERKRNSGRPAASTYQDRWNCHIVEASFIDWPLEEITRHDVRLFLDTLQSKIVRRHGKRQRISPRTVSGVVAVLRMIFNDAVRDELIAKNPAAEHELPKVVEDDDAPPPHLDFDEQVAFLSCESIPDWARVLVGFSIGSGLRAGELVNMPLEDLETAVQTGILPVRFGARGRRPKNGPRRVPLVPFAIEMATRWLELLPEITSRNPHQLAFPAPTGHWRARSAPLGVQGKESLWHVYSREAGIHRIPWHGLRHTCASALLSGLWGRPWTPQEVAGYIGDSLAVATKVYARLTGGALAKAAQSTPGGPVTNGSRDRDFPGENGTSAQKRSIWKELTISAGFRGSDGSCDPTRDPMAECLLLRERMARGEEPTEEEFRRGAASLLLTSPLPRACLLVLEGGPFQGRRFLELVRLLQTDIPASQVGEGG